MILTPCLREGSWYDSPLFALDQLIMSSEEPRLWTRPDPRTNGHLLEQIDQGKLGFFLTRYGYRRRRCCLSASRHLVYHDRCQ